MNHCIISHKKTAFKIIHEITAYQYQCYTYNLISWCIHGWDSQDIADLCWFFVVVVVLSHCVSSACLVFSDVAAKNCIPAQCQINRSLLPLYTCFSPPFTHGCAASMHMDHYTFKRCLNSYLFVIFAEQDSRTAVSSGQAHAHLNVWLIASVQKSGVMLALNIDKGFM